MSNRLDQIQSLGKAIGWPAAATTLMRRALGRTAARPVTIGGRTVTLRPCDSDLFVAGQIFGKEEYRLGGYREGLLNLAQSWVAAGITPLILDIGANVGYSAIYFAERFPMCTVVAVEADATTYRALKTNVQDHPRIVAIEAAVWNHEQGVDFGVSQELGSWAHRVEGAEGTVRSVVLASTYSGIENGRPLIVKLDVEGAEKQIAEQAADILNEVPCILIEPHDFMLPGEGVLSPMLAALSGRKIDTILRDEVLMFFDSALAPKG